MTVGIAGVTNYRNQQEINEFVDGEAKARRLLLPHYSTFGFCVIDTNGNKARDIEAIWIATGDKYKIEEKYRDGDYGDLLVEIIQDMVKPDWGWFYKTEADYLFYVNCTEDWVPTTVRIIKWKLMKRWLLNNWGKSYIRKETKPVISDKGIGLTLNLAVKWNKLPHEYIKKYDLGKEG